MHEFDAENAAAGLWLAQRAASTIRNSATVIPVEARQLEWLAVHLFDLGECRADANAVRARPGRLILGPDPRRPAPRLLVPPGEFQPRFRVIGIKHAGLDFLVLPIADLLVSDVVVSECLHQAGMAAVATEASFAFDHARRRRALRQCHRRAQTEQPRHQARRCDYGVRPSRRRSCAVSPEACPGADAIA